MQNEGILTKMKAINWFARVGEPIESAGCRSVANWSDAFRYASDEITKWCSMEAGLRLYNNLAAINYERFRKWNEIALSYAAPVDIIMAKAMATSGIPEFPQHAKTELRFQLIGALMEEAFDDVLSVALCRQQVNLMIEGHFPCGWEVMSADDFPEKALMLVY